MLCTVVSLYILLLFKYVKSLSMQSDIHVYVNTWRIHYFDSERQNINLSADNVLITVRH